MFDKQKKIENLEELAKRKLSKTIELVEEFCESEKIEENTIKEFKESINSSMDYLDKKFKLDI